MESYSRLRWLVFLTSFVIFAFQVSLPQAPPQPENIETHGTSFLDHETPISQFWGKTFLKENIPFIEIPDKTIQDVYYYRWSSLQRHLRYTVAGTGYILTEFCQPVGYAQALNTINAAAGHQIDEARWLRSRFYLDDYIQAYTLGPGNTTQYTHWILDALYRRSKVDGDKQFAINQLADMARLWHEWDYTFDMNAGLYHFTPNFDAQEYSLPGFVVAPTGNDQLQYDGPDTYRPSLNAYMVANARAIAAVANYAGNSKVESNFTPIGSNLEAAVNRHLWSPDQQFYVDVIRPNNPDLKPISGREEVGLYPYRFGIGLESNHSGAALALFDPQGFQAPLLDQTILTENFQSWPFSTAHILKSLAAIYRVPNLPITADQYLQTLSTKRTECLMLLSLTTLSRTLGRQIPSNHSEHYDHSTNNDDVITGLLGIVPQSNNSLLVSPIMPKNWTYFAIENFAYHGHLISVLYDADSKRYKCGGSFCVFSDGKQIVSKNPASPIHELISLDTALISSGIPVNIAANPNGFGYYPMANATYTFYADNRYKAIDGYLFYDDIPKNRWTNYQSKSSNDTLQITFARPRTISSVTLALYSDVARGGGVDVPAAIEIYGSSELIANLTNSTFLPNDRNTFFFKETKTSYVAVNLFNRPGKAVGVCELEVWTPPISGPTYYAVDSLLTNAAVVKDAAASAGSVVGQLAIESVVAFSGIESAGGTVKLALSYSNNGSTAMNIDVKVNQVRQITLSLSGTKGKYAIEIVTGVHLEAGKNFVTLLGGSSQLRIESINI
ncbi:hypothetical protein LAWI1_G000921 [Lachnellula willkommii]|uniref:Mannosylglycerate hydrolase MGH1-like glycoside hydrolase domain-containing protein n=1 Tax=Lachnellula willkommii TaxID=215461 RepID=A0A559ML18_9HELO|nr:hypothetical protein LAWI1_G000921 [Lachnellula willkommii]